ncbi:hypothetical protein THAOC_07967 [Thalassiosira oceanica]|uniref:Dynamin-type G domain-containing protein n=1 Tax=Thalassiosira oceanica TaxID=159749 RepID=K0T0D5_THAOC|nr:hypothetical protein THAOC_07967 [Thalassiosira oceanica]|eukprot:EJK70654.1 hypothetical protein THAOC_07967 [Thalassiosira oceanica]
MAAGTLQGYERYHQFMDKLKESNVDKYVDLPMIAVMGDTSSGKSSLLSNISEIELPSADVLTTRCPIMLKMHHRSARVKITWKDKPEGTSVDFTPVEISESSWSDITNAISAAQTHIVEKSGKEVARDIVSVDLHGPNCENLTLIDLPGIVRSVGIGESTSLTDDIQSLMEDYLKNPRCVILAVQPSNVDFHNSQIMAEARKVDPNTTRTIPVLTKPDLIDIGGEASVRDLLLGKKQKSLRSDFTVQGCVLLVARKLLLHSAPKPLHPGRGQLALDNSLSIGEGVQQEDAFFRNTEPWKNVEDRTLFGTSASDISASSIVMYTLVHLKSFRLPSSQELRTKLSKLLMELIRTSFKDIVAEMRQKRGEALVDYEALGSIPSDLADKRALFLHIRKEFWYPLIGQR